MHSRNAALEKDNSRDRPGLLDVDNSLASIILSDKETILAMAESERSIKLHSHMHSKFHTNASQRDGNYKERNHKERNHRDGSIKDASTIDDSHMDKLIS